MAMTASSQYSTRSGAIENSTGLGAAAVAKLVEAA
jgi:hypothetical protein